jgi:hypothetical protein
MLVKPDGTRWTADDLRSRILNHLSPDLVRRFFLMSRRDHSSPPDLSDTDRLRIILDVFRDCKQKATLFAVMKQFHRETNKWPPRPLIETLLRRRTR